MAIKQLRSPKTPVIFQVVDPVFKTVPIFIVGCSAEEAEAVLLKRFHVRVSIPRGACGTMLARQTYPWRVVWSQHYPSGPQATAELLHEIFHLVVRICGDKGVPIVHHIESGECGDEAAAYLFEFFTQEALRKFRRRKAA